MKDKVYYTIEKHKKGWVVWLNADKDKSSYCKGLFTGSVRECVKYAKENKFRIKGGVKNIEDKIPTWKELLFKNGNINS